MSTPFDELVILSPLDHIVPQAYVSFLLYFRTECPMHCLSLLKAGVTSLTKVLPILLGDVVVNPELDGKYNVQSVQIPCTKEDDTILVHKNHPFPIETCSGGVQEASDSKRHLCPLPPLVPLTQRQPVIRFQANLFTDGLVLAMTFNHVVFDGTGAGKILELLARCCRDPSATPLPLTFEKENDVRSAIFGVPGNTYPVQDHRGGVGPAKAIPPVPPDAASLRTCRFEFNIERILRLKRQCAQLLKHGCIFQPGSADLPPFLSSNDVLTSALADAVQRARCNSKEARTYDWLDLCMAVNMRDRIELPIAREFLGNMAFNLRLTTPAPDHEPERCLDCRPTDDGPIPTSQLRFITELACQLRNKIRSMDRDYFHSLMTYVANQKDWSQTGMIFTDLAFTSWRHVDICGLDFGITFGSVHDFDLVFGLVDGAVIALPKRPPPDPKDQKDPNWDIHITLPAKDLEALVEDDLIRWLMGR